MQNCGQILLSKCGVYLFLSCLKNVSADKIVCRKRFFSPKELEYALLYVFFTSVYNDDAFGCYFIVTTYYVCISNALLIIALCCNVRHKGWKQQQYLMHTQTNNFLVFFISHMKQRCGVSL